MIGWYGGRPPIPADPPPAQSAGVAPNGEGWFDPCVRDHDFPRHGPRPEVVTHLEQLLAAVGRLRPVEAERDPRGVLWRYADEPKVVAA